MLWIQFSDINLNNFFFPQVCTSDKGPFLQQKAFWL